MLERVQMVAATVIAAQKDPNTEQLANWLRDIFGPIFLVVISIVGLFFLFTREITRFIQFLVLAIAIAVIFYYPGIITAVAGGIVRALGVEGSQ
ncbi:hypothetical protein [Spirillospora sp. CA-128828]|uniref:hypothetical protein n=1 Tax=Spirillospora sp. CA-128828 TaxID=3240033 RepID=UPI003D8A4884